MGWAGSMTAEELRKTAETARALAMDCLVGKAPTLIAWQLCETRGCIERYCVAGLLGKRATGQWDLIHRFPPVLEDAVEMLVTANNETQQEDRHAAVVFPLLAIADELDAAAEAPPEAPSPPPF